MMGCFVTRIASYLKAWNPVWPVYDIVGSGKGTRIDIDVMHHTKIVYKLGDTFRLVRREVGEDDESDNEEGDDTNMEEDNSHTSLGFGTFSGAGIVEAGSSFQLAFDMSNEEVLTRMIPRMDMLDAHFQGIETMISDRFRSIELMHGSLESPTSTPTTYGAHWEQCARLSWGKKNFN
ncbi:hypothetical protein JCGZ_12657 [Jatropha curcas]|uniref:Uncharacterized protein n=1 Tax=Jatropha curcas TaxID=180498 RepID=A0A067KR68_JATCU|nr:hypothetical protein JCGZ_12657 [Jatropha curcas]